jgi:hypothetical protein
MKLKSLLCVVVPSLALQACVSTPSLNEAAQKLNVHSDNRVSLVSSDGLHAWSNDNNILALRIKERLINARDIASVRTIDLRTSPKPLRIDVQLRTGEHVTDDVADWGYGVEWAACTPARSCKYLERPYQQRTLGAVDFPGFPKLLLTLDDADIKRQAERLVTSKRPSGEADIRLRQDAGAILPSFARNPTLTFEPSFQVPNTKTMVEAEMKIVAAIADCANEKRRAKAQAERDAEAAFMRSNPSPAEVKNRARYKAMQPNNFMTDWSESECSRQIRG